MPAWILLGACPRGDKEQVSLELQQQTGGHDVLF